MIPRLDRNLMRINTARSEVRYPEDAARSFA